MKARVVSFGSGARWLVEGWRLFRVSPGLWLALVLAYWMILATVNMVPVIGSAAWILHPAFSVGFMALSRSCERRGNLEAALLFEGFRGRPAVQLVLGCAYLGLLAALVGATTLADGGALARWMLTGRRPATEALQSDEFLGALALAASLYLPVMMMFWFAPPLVAWHSASPAKALFYSFFGALMNWRAFLVYGAAAGLITLVIPFVLAVTLRTLIGGVSFAWLAFPLLGVMLPTLFASFYASYRDVFATPE